MADWTYETGDALTRKAWAKKWLMEGKPMSYYYANGLVGSDEENDYIAELMDLEKDQGDRITIGQVRDLAGDGVTGDSTMENNEESPSVYDDTITLNYYRNAVRLAGRMSGQRPADNKLREKANKLLRRWLANTRIDQDIFTAIADSPTKAIYGGDAISTATIDSTDYFTLDLVSKAVVYAEKATPEIFGKMVDGEAVFQCVISPDQKFDVMRRDASWGQAQREAVARSKNNPIFKNSVGMHQSTVIRSHKRVAIATDWGSGSNVNGATALFMGVGAGSIAYAKRVTYDVEAFDYSNKVGFCIGTLMGVTKNVFNSLDNAVVAIRTARSNN